MSRRLWLFLLPVLLAGLVFLWPRSEVTGRVVDEQGRPISDARVRWQTTSLTTRTDASGRFLLPPGPIRGRITAAQEGYFIAGAEAEPNKPLELVLRPLPDDHPEYVWTDPGGEANAPGNCAGCHADLYREWSRSGHARSVTGRFFRDLYEGRDAKGRTGVSWGVLTQNEPGAAVCVSCHAPAVRDDEPDGLDIRQLKGTVTRGIHCDYCHKVEGLTGPIDGLSHGRFNLRLRRPDPVSGEQLFFGPLDDVDRGDDSFSTFQRDSRFCAACHEGVVFGVPVYTTYSEWQASPAGQRGTSCQSCHLRPTGQMSNLAPDRGGRRRDPQTLANHRFFAGSRDEMLRQALTLDGEIRREEGENRITIRIATDQVGHRVPTGYIDRQVILVLEGWDASEQPVPAEAGPVLPASAGSLAGRPGRLFAKSVSDTEGRRPGPFWASRNDVQDTRLYPERTETTTWRFPPSVVRLQARLLYRPFWEEVARAKGWPLQETVVRDLTLRLPPLPEGSGQ